MHFFLGRKGVAGAGVRPDPSGAAAQVLHLRAGPPDADAHRRPPDDPRAPLVRRRQRHPVRVLAEKGQSVSQSVSQSSLRACFCTIFFFFLQIGVFREDFSVCQSTRFLFVPPTCLLGAAVLSLPLSLSPCLLCCSCSCRDVTCPAVLCSPVVSRCCALYSTAACSAMLCCGVLCHGVPCCALSILSDKSTNVTPTGPLPYRLTQPSGPITVGRLMCPRTVPRRLTYPFHATRMPWRASRTPRRRRRGPGRRRPTRTRSPRSSRWPGCRYRRARSRGTRTASRYSGRCPHPVFCVVNVSQNLNPLFFCLSVSLSLPLSLSGIYLHALSPRVYETGRNTCRKEHEKTRPCRYEKHGAPREGTCLLASGR